MGAQERKFFGIIKRRSEENMKSFALLYGEKCYGNCVSILRQELDSYIRVMFLDNHPLKNIFIKQTLDGDKWKNTGKRITDKQMREFLSYRLNGWEECVYDLGCAFIHLSSFHNYATENPLGTLPKNEREIIAGFIKQYHNIDIDLNDIKTVIPVLPLVMKKINENLLCAISREN